MKATLTGAALALAMAIPAYAETPQTVPGSSIEGTNIDKNPGALTAPDKNKSDMSPNANTNTPDTGAANVPGSSAEGNKAPDQNEGALSSPEKDTMGKQSQSSGGMSDDSSANCLGRTPMAMRPERTRAPCQLPRKTRCSIECRSNGEGGAMRRLFFVKLERFET